ncbi:protein kinase family protein [Streptosporangium soli]|nr:hypothetical protein [Streptosporangium sp. KLBMP 9127]
MDNTSLEQMIGRIGPMPPQRVAGIGLNLLAELSAAGGTRSVRPDLVMLAPDGRVSLADDTGQNPPPAGYTPPEGMAGPASALWALGATLYTAIEGRPPAAGSFATHAGPLGPILHRMLSPDSAQRPDATTLWAQLQDIAANRPPATPSSPRPTRAPATNPLPAANPHHGPPATPGTAHDPGHAPGPDVGAGPAPGPALRHAPDPNPGPEPFPSHSPDPYSGQGRDTDRDPGLDPGLEAGPGHVPEPWPGHGPGYSSDRGPGGLHPDPGPTSGPGPGWDAGPGLGSGPTSGPGPGPNAGHGLGPGPTSGLGSDTGHGLGPAPDAGPGPGSGHADGPGSVPAFLPPGTAPTQPPFADLPRRNGVLVPRWVIALAGALAVAMAVSIGVLAAPLLGGGNAPAASPSQTPSAAPADGEKGRFAAAPRACSLLDDAVAAELVPTLKISEVAPGECNWLASDWRLPNGAKYDLRLRITFYKPDGNEVTKAREHFTGRRDDLAGKVKYSTPKPSPPQPVNGIGDESLTFTEISSINLYGGSTKSLLLIRVSNVIAEIEYEHGGAKGDKDGRLATGAEKAARAVVGALNDRD